MEYDPLNNEHRDIFEYLLAEGAASLDGIDEDGEPNYEIITPEYEEYNEEYDLRVHYCGDPSCKEDCGELWCGCIDVCRGRCGTRRFERY